MNAYHIKFGVSRSHSYQDVVNYVSKIGTYSCEQSNNRLVHSVTVYDTQLYEFFNIYQMIRSWRSSRFFINGEDVTDNLSFFIHCFRDCYNSGIGKDFCYNKYSHNGVSQNHFGCRYIRLLSRYDFEGLINHGYFDDTGVFMVNKTSIKNEILSYKQNLCPMFDIGSILYKIDGLPDAINPREDSDWEYVIKYEGDKKIAVSVRMKEKIEGFVLNDDNPTTNEKLSNRIFNRIKRFLDI